MLKSPEEETKERTEVADENVVSQLFRFFSAVKERVQGLLPAGPQAEPRPCLDALLGPVCRFKIAEVFYWGISVEGVGHLSLQLDNGTYISHWPEQNKGTGSLAALELLSSALESKADHMASLSGDVETEERQPDESVSLPDGLVDEEDISRWWKTYCKTSRYALLYSNCAQTVKLALEVGGIEGPPFIGVAVTPLQVFRWVKRCVRRYEKTKKRR
ncbi:uncharacterized protein LOC118433186 [Folsomia candida]|uniref:Uncharacterized protein n=1 Tax=Folsomia candida TaxID=158441 RepID=A0A226D2F1_FOLCA|nr:uncharacterized protein LOC118433186 [Folsomia candida]OXA38831.1 hypothetical protein Fcan01_26412 [Folsomia candida]